MKLHTVFKITHCVKLTLRVKLHIVCKIKHWVKEYSSCVKSQTVCEITNIPQDSIGVPFTLNMEKNSTHFKIFTLTPFNSGLSDKYQVCVKLHSLWACCTKVYSLKSETK